MRGEKDRPVLAVDPGRGKCGVAVVYPSGEVAEQAVVPREELIATLESVVSRYDPVALALGDRTGARECRNEWNDRLCPVVFVDEHRTTQNARTRYFADHPPRGWRRLVPQGLLSPPRPVDDYAAILLAETFWSARGMVHGGRR